MAEDDNIVHGRFPPLKQDIQSIEKKIDAEAFARSFVSNFNPEVLQIMSATLPREETIFTESFGRDLIDAVEKCKVALSAIDAGIVGHVQQELGPNYTVENAHKAVQSQVRTLLSVIHVGVPKLILAMSPDKEDYRGSPLHDIGLVAYDISVALGATPSDVKPALMIAREKLQKAREALLALSQEGAIVSLRNPGAGDPRKALAMIHKSLAATVDDVLKN